MDDLQRIRLAIETMRGGPPGDARSGSAADGGQQPGEHAVTWWPHYDKRVFEALQAAHVRVAGPDPDYLNRIQPLLDAPISTASMSDLATWFTYLMRGDHFNDGFLLAFIEDGRLLQMFERLVEIHERNAHGR